MFGAREGRDEKGKWVYWQSREVTRMLDVDSFVLRKVFHMGCIGDFLRSLGLSQGRIGILGSLDPALSQSGERGGISRCSRLMVCGALRYKWLQYWFVQPWALRRQVMDRSSIQSQSRVTSHAHSKPAACA